MSPQRRDADGRWQSAHSWESLVERQIREAMEQGAFDELPHRGKRIPIENDDAAGEWAMAHRMLRNAGAAPPWIESDKEARRLLAAIEALLEVARHGSRSTHTRARELTALVEAANAAIRRLNSEAPTPRQHRRPLDLDEQLGRLERAVETA
jgi:signal transduction histidine kinase